MGEQEDKMRVICPVQTSVHTERALDGMLCFSSRRFFYDPAASSSPDPMHSHHCRSVCGNCGYGSCDGSGCVMLIISTEAKMVLWLCGYQTFYYGIFGDLLLEYHH